MIQILICILLPLSLLIHFVLFLKVKQISLLTQNELMDRAITTINIGVTNVQDNPEFKNPYEVGSFEYRVWNIGANAGKLFLYNMTAFKGRYEASIVAGYKEEMPVPAVPWLRECYDTGLKIKAGKL